MQENLAIASVPIQEWGVLYGAEEALRVGTIFQDLNKPFFAADEPQGDACGQGNISGQQADGAVQGDGSGLQADRVGQGTGSGQASAERKAEARIGHCDRAATPEQQERERMMTNIQETGFVLDDLRLYLDTHPDDRQGLALLKNKLAERKALLLAFAQKFYPLTVDCMADLYENNPAPECYCWQKGPMPWEGACV